MHGRGLALREWVVLLDKPDQSKPTWIDQFRREPEWGLAEWMQAFKKRLGELSCGRRDLRYLRDWIMELYYRGEEPDRAAYLYWQSFGHLRKKR